MNVTVAPGIADDSWLHRGDEEFEDFKRGYAYARNVTMAIPALAKVTPEEAFWIWSTVQHGATRTSPAAVCTCDPPNEFGIAACDLPEHCEHSSRSGDGAGGWVCDVCGHTISDSAAGRAAAPGPPHVQGADGGST